MERDDKLGELDLVTELVVLGHGSTYEVLADSEMYGGGGVLTDGTGDCGELLACG